MAPGVRPNAPPAVRPKKDEESQSNPRARSTSPRVRPPIVGAANPSSVSSKPSPRSSKETSDSIPTEDSKETDGLDTTSTPRASRSSERKTSPIKSPSGSRERGSADVNKSYIKLKSSFDALSQRLEEILEANSKMASQIQALESKQAEHEANTSQVVFNVVSSQVKVLLKRIVTLEDTVQKEIVLSDNHNHYAMTDERNPTGTKPKLSSAKAKNGDDIVLSDNHNHYAMTDERNPTGTKPKLSSGKTKKSVLSRLSVLGRGSSMNSPPSSPMSASPTSLASKGDMVTQGQPPKDTILLTKPKSVIQIRAEKYEQQKLKLSEAFKDDREEWEKRADGDLVALQAHQELQETPDLSLTIREKIALRRGSTRDVRAVKELNTTGRLSALGVQSTEVKEGRDQSEGGDIVVVAKTLELSAEEKAMNGAPEGKLFVVEVLPRDQLPPFETDDEASNQISNTVLPVLGTEGEGLDHVDKEWNEEFDALTFLRRVLVHHVKCVDETLIEKVAKGIDRCSRNTRSVLAKNAICCIEDLFLACGSRNVLRGNESATELFALALLDSCASNMPKILKTEAASALDQATSSSTPPLVLCSLVQCMVSQSSHKNRDIAVHAVTYTTKTLQQLKEKNIDVRSLELEVMLSSLLHGLNGRTPEGKKAAKQACTLIAECLGSNEEYDSLVNGIESMTDIQREDLIKAREESGGNEDESNGDVTPMSPAEMRTMKIKELREKAKAKAKAKEMLKSLEKNSEDVATVNVVEKGV